MAEDGSAKMLLIPLATRGRPDLLLNTLQITSSNIKEEDTRIVVLVDFDDHKTTEIIDKICVIPHCCFFPIKREASLGAKYNRISDWTLTVGYIPTCYLAMVDYTPITTPGFDSLILSKCDEFPDGIGVFLSDKANLSFSGLNGWTTKTAQALGYLYPPYFPYWFLDHWIEDVAWMVNRVIHVPISIDRQLRPGTQNKRDFPYWCNFWNHSVHLRELDAQKLINEMNPHWATWNKASWPLIHQRSSILYQMMLMDYQRSQEPEVEDSILHASLRAQANQLMRTQTGESK